MAVNENDDHFALFIEMHSDKFLDKDAEYTHPIPSTAAPSVNKQFIEDSCEGGGSQLNLDEGDTVRTQLNGKTIICTIAKLFRTANGSIRAKVRPLNSDHTLVIDPERIQHISPDPSDVPSGPQQVDRGSLTHCITEEEAKQLWNPKIDDTTTPESRIALHWHHRLRCAPLITLQRLTKRGVLSKCILKLTRMPLCASCLFAKAHKRGWRVRNGSHRPIRREI